MAAAMAKLAAQHLMERETRLREGRVDMTAFGDGVDRGNLRIEGGEFLFETPEGLRFHYRRGEGVTVDRSHAQDTSFETLWRNGSVYAAVASINGLLPVHASAVACNGGVIAFTGPSGAGKSTLATALGAHGLPLFCDDTLVLDLSAPDRLMCLPGHKRLKLTAEAIALTGATAQEDVAAGLGKRYALPPAGIVSAPLPLAGLMFLEDCGNEDGDDAGGGTARIEPITGAERMLRLQDDHYTADLFASARRFSRAEMFAHLARLARQIAMTRFVRPRDAAQFHDGVARVARYVTGTDKLRNPS